MTRITRLGTLVATMVLMGCGSPPPEGPAAGEATGSADAIGALPGGDAPRTSSGANAPARQAPTQASPLGPIAQPVSTLQALPTGTIGTPCPTPDERVEAECAQREARISWDAEMREHPDGTGRLQAMELGDEQLSDDIELVTYRVVDEDEQLLAQELWEEQFIQEVEEDTL